MQDSGIEAAFDENFSFDVTTNLLASEEVFDICRRCSYFQDFLVFLLKILYSCEQVNVVVLNLDKSNKVKDTIGRGSFKLSTVPINSTYSDQSVDLFAGQKQQGKVLFKCLIEDTVAANKSTSAPESTTPAPTAPADAKVSQNSPAVTSLSVSDSGKVQSPSPVPIASKPTAVISTQSSNKSSLPPSRDSNIFKSDAALPAGSATPDGKKSQPSSTPSTTTTTQGHVPQSVPSHLTSATLPEKSQNQEEDPMIKVLKKQLEVASAETQQAQMELQRLMKEVELKTLQAQLKQREDQKHSADRHMETLRRALTQMNEAANDRISAEDLARIIPTTVPLEISDVDNSEKPKITSKKVESKAEASKKRSAAAKERIKAAKMKIAESTDVTTHSDRKNDGIEISVPKRRAKLWDRDTDEEEDISSELRGNTLKNKKLSMDTESILNKRKQPDGQDDYYSSPLDEEADEELIVIQETPDDFDNSRSKNKKRVREHHSVNSDESSRDSLRYPYRANKPSLPASTDSELPPNRYPLRPSSSLVKEIAQLKKSTEDTVGALMSKLTMIEKALNEELNSSDTSDELKRQTAPSNARIPETAPMLNRTAPASLLSSVSVQPAASYRHPALLHKEMTRSDRIDWKDVRSSLNTGKIHAAVSDVLMYGYSDDVVSLLKIMGPSPQKLSVAHRNRIFETIARVLSNRSANSETSISGELPYSGQPDNRIDVCLSWVFALVQEGLTSTLSRSCHAHLLDALVKVSQEQVNDAGVMASRYEYELRGAY